MNRAERRARKADERQAAKDLKAITRTVVGIARSWAGGDWDGISELVDQEEVDGILELTQEAIRDELGELYPDFLLEVTFHACRMTIDDGPQPRIATLFALPLRGSATQVSSMAADVGASGEGDGPARPPALRVLVAAMKDTGMLAPASRVVIAPVVIPAEGLASLTLAGMKRITDEFGQAVATSNAGMQPDLRLAETAILDECGGFLARRATGDLPTDGMHVLLGIHLMAFDETGPTDPDFFLTLEAAEDRTVDGEILESPEVDVTFTDAEGNPVTLDGEHEEAPGEIRADDEADPGEEEGDPEFAAALEKADKGAADWVPIARSVTAPFGVVPGMPSTIPWALNVVAGGVLRERLEAATATLLSFEGTTASFEPDDEDCVVTIRKLDGEVVLGSASIPGTWLGGGTDVVVDQVRRLMERKDIVVP